MRSGIYSAGSAAQTIRAPFWPQLQSLYWERVEVPKIDRAPSDEGQEEVTTDLPRPTANAEIEDKGRLPDELAAQIARRLDAGMRPEVPGWGYFAARPHGVSRIIDRYYDTPDRMFQTWSRAHSKQLLLRDRQKGRVVGAADTRNIHTLADVVRLPVEDETHTWVAKVPLKGVNANSRIRLASEHEAPYTDRDREAVGAELMGIIRQIPGIELDPTTVAVRECVGKVRKSYAVFAQTTAHAPERHVATIDLNFIVREYYQSSGVSLERYAKYEAEKQKRATAREFAACTRALRAVLHIPKEEPLPILLTPPTRKK